MCGIAFVADVRGNRSRSIVDKALTTLAALEHRGAQGADPLTGDGAGILLQLPDGFLRQAAREDGIELPAPGLYGVGMAFLPRDEGPRAMAITRFERLAGEEGIQVLGWRDVPVADQVLGPQARETAPKMRQVFVRCDSPGGAPDAFERKLYVLRRRAERDLALYFASLSTRTIVYKGLLLPSGLGAYFHDLRESTFASAMAMVHSRFSTNTFPSWELAHPYRYLSHNGEINTLRGNVNWMKAREGRFKSELFGADIEKLKPIIRPHQSDSACLDNALEFLVQGGRSLPHAMMMLIPEPWAGNPHMDLERRGFYEYHAAMMEPWDGPAAVVFTDGKLVGATLDRNGLRPCRYQVTTDGLVVLASEAGVLPEEPAKIRSKERLQPGRMFLVDLEQGRIVDDEEIKSEISRRKPYRGWVTQYRVSLDELPEPTNVPQPDHLTLRHRQKAFGYTIEELNFVMTPMVVNGEEPISSMGSDTPVAILSDRPQPIFKYFRQLFAQVTNPPIDPIREQLVMSLVTNIGPRFNLLVESPEACRRIKIQQPILTNSDLQKIRDLADPNFRSKTLPIVFDADGGPDAMEKALVELRRSAVAAIQEGYKFLILSDRGVSRDHVAIPSLLAVASLQTHLVEKSLRAEAGIIMETGDPRDVHHFACLLGYGAGSVNPYLAFESLTDMVREGYLPDGIDAATAHTKYIGAVKKGLLKIFSKMGISTVQSYVGGQIFEAVGISREVADQHFGGTVSRIGGMGLREMAEEALRRHQDAYAPAPIRVLESGGDIHYRVQGENHAWNPETIASLQQAARANDAKSYAEFSRIANDESERRLTLRGLLELRFADKPLPLEEVESASQIVKRFTTGAMSLGAISREAHETLAIAMNRIGAKSNTGEGGEDAARYVPDPSGDSRNSAIKQVASARFGVTSHYLVNAAELQIKMAQGAKPGEGGQLPGHKVDEYIARLRHSTPGVQLISPPPHHDIYSIEDLKQLIFDLKNSNPSAAVSVKLVSEIGVGTIAAGVAKAKADKILISGDSGGTGASPLSSIKYAGIPWEMGLAETQRTLVAHGLRSRVRVETDGGLRTGRDVIVAALLGAEEFGFSTAPLIAEGCIMMRKCHLNTCPVGIATQDPVLRAKFTGKPEHVINYLFFVAEEARALMARLGFRKLSELVGRMDHLRATRAAEHWKAKGLDLSSLLTGATEASLWSEPQDHALGGVLDRLLMEKCMGALEHGQQVTHELAIRNVDRATGTMLSSEVTRRYGEAGLPDGTIILRFKGSAGQSFGAFVARGVTLHLEGDSNDYIGKGLSGGRIVVVPPKGGAFDPAEAILIGNTALYGATSGEAYFHGVAGERFAVRNSGARAVVEGTGDHGCEYMTGGVVVVLGRTGRNFAAGMSGGIAFVFDDDGTFARKCNTGMVELQPVSTSEDRRYLRALIRSHIRHTGSRRAQKMLETWRVSLPKFVKIMPVDYKRVLEERKAKARG